MKSMADMLLRQNAFGEIVMGNTALVRAMVETGTQVITSYPGSPTPEIASAILSIPTDRRPFYFEFSTNEKVATEVAYGASVNGHLSTVFFKSVGLNVAADTFVQLSAMNLLGGMVVVLGDDPGANSSQNEQDNRHYAHLSCTPVFEPADPGEVYSLYKAAAQMSRERGMPVILRLTTHVCHAKQKVAFQAWKPVQPDRTPRFNPGNGLYIPLPAHVPDQKRRALQNLEAVRTASEELPLNRLVDHGNRERGIITMGLPFLSLMDVLQAAGSKPDILKLAIVYPLPRGRILEFLSAHREVLVLEELDDLLENRIKAMAYDARLSTRIVGKLDNEDRIGEYTPDKVAGIISRAWPDLISARPAPAMAALPDRPPQMCPGCGHRSAFHAIKQALRATDISVADIGCHTLGYLPPYRMGQLLMCMGSSPGIGAGLSLFNRTRKVVAFMGDSTFFHAALPGIINAVYNRHNLTLIVMENDTTAMTGHQDHPGSGRNVNQTADKIPIRRVLEGLGVDPIFEIDTYQQQRLSELVRQATEVEGFSAVIARHPCMLKFTRERRRKPGYEPRQVAIDQQACERLHICVAQFGCPSFVRFEDGHVEVNPDLCIGDGSCIQTCPKTAVTEPRKKIEAERE